MCCGDSIASLNGYLNTNFKFFNNAIRGKWAVRNSLPLVLFVRLSNLMCKNWAG